jgi:hypothetical protein
LSHSPSGIEKPLLALAIYLGRQYTGGQAFEQDIGHILTTCRKQPKSAFA